MNFLKVRACNELRKRGAVMSHNLLTNSSLDTHSFLPHNMGIFFSFKIVPDDTDYLELIKVAI